MEAGRPQIPKAALLQSVFEASPGCMRSCLKHKNSVGEIVHLLIALASKTDGLS